MASGLRHLLGVTALVVYGSGLCFWCIIHPWVRFWRRLGPAPTYAIVGAMLAMLGAGIYRFRATLLGRDLGTQPVVMTLGILLFGACVWLGVRYGMRAEHLSVRTRAGLPELSPADSPGKLVRGGLYGVVRHPIYASAAAVGIAMALIVNHIGTYVFFLAAMPMLYGVTLLEERELIDRFGEEYREYRRHVPRFIPRLHRRRRP